MVKGGNLVSQTPINEEGPMSSSLAERSKGTPQGVVISPLLANLILHYAFDKEIR